MARVIYILGNSVSTREIYPDRYIGIPNPPPPADCAFGNDPVLNGELINKIPGKNIAIVCGTNFGSGVQRNLAAQALAGHLIELNVIVSSATPQFDNDCRQAGFNIIVCPTLKADINDDLDIQSNQVINRTQNRTFPRV